MHIGGNIRLCLRTQYSSPFLVPKFHFSVVGKSHRLFFPFFFFLLLWCLFLLLCCDRREHCFWEAGEELKGIPVERHRGPNTPIHTNTDTALPVRLEPSGSLPRPFSPARFDFWLLNVKRTPNAFWVSHTQAIDSS